MTSTDKPVVSEEISKLWSLLPHPSNDHVVRLFARSGEKKFGDYARKPEDIMRFIDSSPGMNIYVGPNPTKCTTGVRHKSEDVTHWSWLLLDVDPLDNVPLEECDPHATLKEGLLWLGEWMGRDLGYGKPGTVIVDSGRGAQAWLRLEDYLCADSMDDVDNHRRGGPICIGRSIARKSSSYWLKRVADKLGTMNNCRLDSCTSDLPRVMRCPGTLNTRTKRSSSLVASPGGYHAGLSKLLLVGTPPSVYAEPEPGQVAPGTSWQLVYSKLTIKAQNYLSKGKEDPGRHETMWHTCQKLKEVGIEKDEARKALQHANNLLGPDYALPEDQIETDLKQVYGA